MTLRSRKRLSVFHVLEAALGTLLACVVQVDTTHDKEAPLLHSTPHTTFTRLIPNDERGKISRGGRSRINNH